MKITEKMLFCSKLMDEIQEEVLTNYGSPPFPKLGEFGLIKTQLDNFLHKHKDKIDTL